ncbi:uncharacterized protein PAC_01501 [Phialocephala subalpina]|uniref:Uncharacterized protein n=1 Tax=Phialocephala subalpina TaxID=576137 RepID=A0A1L7WFS6_9HELO|nr:uncharacterized protein PAC_01501 [Phialocephala subalpina]
MSAHSYQVWSFTCGHELASPHPKPGYGLPDLKTSPEQCPSSKEELRKTSISEAQRKKNNEDVVNEFEKMLSRCNTLWAGKIAGTEKERSARDVFAEAVESLLEKVSFLMKTEETLSKSNHLLNIAENNEKLKDLQTKLYKLSENFSDKVDPRLKVLEQKLGVCGKEFLEIVKAVSARREGQFIL